MSFWTTFADLARAFAPVILVATVPGAGPMLAPVIGDLIGLAEQAFGPGTGPTKKTFVQAAADVIIAANTAKGTVVLDPTVVSSQVGTAIDLVVGVIKDVQKVQASRQPPAVGPVPV